MYKPVNVIPYGHQDITDEDIEAVVKVLKSDFLTQGEMVPIFELALSDYTNAKYAVATNSGTSALHIACIALGLEKGKSLWTTPISFVASANCGLYCGANVDFVDIDHKTWNIDIDKLVTKLEVADRENKLPYILVVVHFAGLPCDMERIKLLSKKYKFLIVEDACHALGGSYKNNRIGSCSYSDITVFSFHPVKSITTGEGGMATTNDKSLADTMRLLRSHGITRDINENNKQEQLWHYEQIYLGFNYRMTDIQAALGITQLKKLNNFVIKRNQIADTYHSSLSHLNLQLPYRDNQYYSAQHLFIVRIQLNNINRKHYEVFNYLRDHNIGVNLHYIPIYKQPYYKSIGYRELDFPESESYYSEAITLPMFPELKNEEIKYIVSTLEKALK